jgi:hypothetical protein
MNFLNQFNVKMLFMKYFYRINQDSKLKNMGVKNSSNGNNEKKKERL